MTTWPTPQDYNEAIQMPAFSFEDAELRTGQPDLSPLGLPRPITGAFASVYRVRCQSHDWAVRCFLRDVADQHKRYQILSRYLPANGTAYTAGFQYIPQGIKLPMGWFPILKMEWLEGKSLEQFVNEYIGNPQTMQLLAERFKQLVLALNRKGLAHGDLQHGNIIVVPTGIKLVDYDGMYVPDFRGNKATELGHPNYQHPLRSAEHFGAYLDNFSAWVIYSSLLMLSIDKGLWRQLVGGDECLLFRQTDFANPYRSYAFAVLEHHASPEIQHMARVLRSLLQCGPDGVPPLSQEVTPLKDMPTLPDPVSLLSTRVTSAEWTDSEAPERARNVWPKPEYFEQAVKTPNMVFKDRELRRSQNTFEHAVGKLGMVFHLKGQRQIAVKCFLRDVPDREIRYYELKKAATGAAKPYFIDFEYQREGITDGSGKWFPILKMDWISGPTLDVFVLERLKAGDKAAPDALLFKFRTMMRALMQSGIAHGDISAKNIIVTQAGLKLVDYDNIYIPALSGVQSSEFGDPLYQHPSRNLRHFGPYMDNYPAWVIDNTLSFLSCYPDSFHWGWDYIVQLVRDDQLLYFNQVTNQLVEPVLVWNITAEVKRRAKLMHMLMQFPLEQVPPIVDDFGSNLLKREALMQSINRVLGKYTASP
jgi:tRNA A-37 threonylcarbamoyl transferase component Bud32